MIKVDGRRQDQVEDVHSSEDELPRARGDRGWIVSCPMCDRHRRVSRDAILRGDWMICPHCFAGVKEG
jgi:hypothetical protein